MFNYRITSNFIYFANMNPKKMNMQKNQDGKIKNKIMPSASRFAKILKSAPKGYSELVEYENSTDVLCYYFQIYFMFSLPT